MTCLNEQLSTMRTCHIRQASEVNGILRELRLDMDGWWYTAAYKQRVAGGLLLLFNHHTKEIQQRRKNLIARLEPGAKADSLPAEVGMAPVPRSGVDFIPTGLPTRFWLRCTAICQSGYIPITNVGSRFGKLPGDNPSTTVSDFRSSEWQMLKQIGNAVATVARALASAAEGEPQRLDGFGDHDEVPITLW